MNELEEQLTNIHLDSDDVITYDMVKTIVKHLHSVTLTCAQYLKMIRVTIKEGELTLLETLAERIDTFPPVADFWLKSFWLFRSTSAGIALCEKVLEANTAYVANVDDDLRTLLHHAVDRTDLDACKLLISKGADVNARDICDSTPFLLVLRQGATHSKEEMQILHFLSKTGADVNVTDTSGQSAFLKAVHLDDIELVQYTVKLGANIHHTDQRGNSALIYSCLSSNDDMLNYLFRISGDRAAYIDKTNNFGITALHIAICTVAKTKVELLLEMGANPNLHGSLEYENVVDSVLGSDENYIMHDTYEVFSPLYYAYRSCSKDIIKCLVNHDCDLHALGTDGFSMIHMCADDGDARLAKFLVCLGADVDQESSVTSPSQPRCTPLALAVLRGDTDMIKCLLDCGAQVNKQIRNGWTALYLASGSPHITKILIDNNADVNVDDYSGITPLFYAVQNNCFETAKLLIEHGADIHRPTRIDVLQNSLLHAVVQGYSPNLRMLQLLLSNGASVNVINARGLNPLMHLLQHGSKVQHEMVGSLLKYGSSVNIIDYSGKNAFFINIRTAEALPIARSLSEAGTNVNCVDLNSQTPLISAVQRCSVHDVHALLKANSDVDLKKPIVRAVVAENYSICVMMYLAGCDMNLVNVWTIESGILQYRIPVQNERLLRWLREVTSRPPSMKQLCRTTIRRHLVGRVWSEIYTLPVPFVIQQYLDLVDLESLLV